MTYLSVADVLVLLLVLLVPLLTYKLFTRRAPSGNFRRDTFPVILGTLCNSMACP